MENSLLEILEMLNQNIVEPLTNAISNSFLNDILTGLNNILNCLFRWINPENIFGGVSPQLVASILGGCLLIWVISIFVRTFLKIGNTVFRKFEKGIQFGENDTHNLNTFDDEIDEQTTPRLFSKKKGRKKTKFKIKKRG